MRIFLHIGPHKTGTTAIQHWLWTNKGNLAANGILYPESCRYHFAQHRLSFAMKGMRDPVARDIPVFEREIEDLQSEIEKNRPESVVLSSEEFFSAADGPVDQLRSALPDAEVKVIVYVRDPVEALFSLYNQNTKQPNNSFRTHFLKIAKAPLRFFPQLDFSKFLQPWEVAFGAGQLAVVEYTEDAINSFLDCIQWSGNRPDTCRIINKSLDARAIEVIRIAKHTGLESKKREKIAALATDFFKVANARPYIPDADLLALRSQLAPLYDQVYETYLHKKNPFWPVQNDHARSPVSPPLQLKELVEMFGLAL